MLIFQLLIFVLMKIFKPSFLVGTVVGYDNVLKQFQFNNKNQGIS
jgi:hypothetical protein